MATILLIEDSMELEELFITLFTLQGYGVLTAGDRKEALSKLQECEMELIDVN